MRFIALSICILLSGCGNLIGELKAPEPTIDAKEVVLTLIGESERHGLLGHSLKPFIIKVHDSKGQALAQLPIDIELKEGDQNVSFPSLLHSNDEGEISIPVSMGSQTIASVLNVFYNDGTQQSEKRALRIIPTEAIFQITASFLQDEELPCFEEESSTDEKITVKVIDAQGQGKANVEVNIKPTQLSIDGAELNQEIRKTTDSNGEINIEIHTGKVSSVYEDTGSIILSSPSNPSIQTHTQEIIFTKSAGILWADENLNQLLLLAHDNTDNFRAPYSIGFNTYGTCFRPALEQSHIIIEHHFEVNAWKDGCDHQNSNLEYKLEVEEKGTLSIKDDASYVYAGETSVFISSFPTWGRISISLQDPFGDLLAERAIFTGPKACKP